MDKTPATLPLADFLRELRAGDFSVVINGRQVSADDLASVEVAHLKLSAAMLAKRAQSARIAGDRSAAADLLLQSLVIEHRLGNEFGVTCDIGNLGALYVESGDLARAESCLVRAVTTNEARGARSAIAIDLYWLAHLAIKKRDLPEALRTIERCLSISEASATTHQSAAELDAWIRRKLASPK
jgi:hypothetical protein